MGPSPYTDDASSERLNVGDDASEFLDGDPSSDESSNPDSDSDGSMPDSDHDAATTASTRPEPAQRLCTCEKGCFNPIFASDRDNLCDYCVAGHDCQCSNDRRGSRAGWTEHGSRCACEHGSRCACEHGSRCACEHGSRCACEHGSRGRGKCSQQCGCEHGSRGRGSRPNTKAPAIKIGSWSERSQCILPMQRRSGSESRAPPPPSPSSCRCG